MSDNAAAITLDALKTAKANGLTVSCDLNYRKNLWSREKAGEVMEKLMAFVDVCIANEEDAADVFGIHAKDTDITSGSISREGYKEVARLLTERFHFKKTAITLRESISANDNNWAAMLYDGGEYYFSRKYPVHIVDRVGGGDSFGAGLIYSSLKGFAPQEIAALAQGLGMGQNLANVLQLNIRRSHQAVMDGHLNLAHHEAAVFAQEIISFADGSGPGVVDGSHAVIGLRLLDRQKDVFKGVHRDFFGPGKSFVQSFLTPGPRHPLVGADGVFLGGAGFRQQRGIAVKKRLALIFPGESYE